MFLHNLRIESPAPPYEKFGSKKIRFFFLFFFTKKISYFSSTRSYYYTDYLKSNHPEKKCENCLSVLRHTIFSLNFFGYQHIIVVFLINIRFTLKNYVKINFC